MRWNDYRPQRIFPYPCAKARSPPAVFLVVLGGGPRYFRRHLGSPLATGTVPPAASLPFRGVRHLTVEEPEPEECDDPAPNVSPDDLRGTRARFFSCCWDQQSPRSSPTATSLLPQLTDFDFSPAVIDVSGGPAGVTCEMTFSDALSGVAEATCSFRAPGFMQVQTCTRHNTFLGRSQQRDLLLHGGRSALRRVGGRGGPSVNAVDQTGNALQVLDFELEFVLFLPVKLTVASTPDLMPPALTSFDFNSKTPNVSGGPVDVTCSVGVNRRPGRSQLDRLLLPASFGRFRLRLLRIRA